MWCEQAVKNGADIKRQQPTEKTNDSPQGLRAARHVRKYCVGGLRVTYFAFGSP
jgi:hypothetical protein